MPQGGGWFAAAKWVSCSYDLTVERQPFRTSLSAPPDAVRPYREPRAIRKDLDTKIRPAEELGRPASAFDPPERPLRPISSAPNLYCRNRGRVRIFEIDASKGIENKYNKVEMHNQCISPQQAHYQYK